jgi:hypothetical protein
MMRVGIPEYRLPRDIMADEIDVIRQMGAKITCGVTFGKDITLDSLKADGYAACFMAIGLHGGRNLGVENEDAPGVLQGVDFLRDAAMGKDVEIGEDVIVVGGGNVAIDVALTAKRKGAKNVTLICLEKREEMPAWEHEIEEALEGDIDHRQLLRPQILFHRQEQQGVGHRIQDLYGGFRRKPPLQSLNMTTPPASLISATPSSPSVRAPTWRASQSQGIAITPPRRPGSRPADAANAHRMGLCRRRRLLRSQIGGGRRGLRQGSSRIHPPVHQRPGSDRAAVSKNGNSSKPDTANEPQKKRTTVRCLDPEARECNFLEVSFGYDEQEAKTEAERCLEMRHLLGVLPVCGRLPGQRHQSRHAAQTHGCGRGVGDSGAWLYTI